MKKRKVSRKSKLKIHERNTITNEIKIWKKKLAKETDPKKRKTYQEIIEILER